MALMLLLQIILGIVIPAAAKIGMGFTKYPESVTAPVGDEVTFECAVEVPGERLTWRWKPVDSVEESWREVDGVSDRDRLFTRLVVEVKEDTPNALYQCIAWYGAISVVSTPARLSIAKMDLSRNIAEKRVIMVPLHNTVVLHCKEPISEPPAILNWWKEDGKIKKQLDTPHGVLILHNVSTADSGVYGCSATNELSTQTEELPEKTYLKVQHEGNGGERFIETEDYVGTKDAEGTLTVSVKIDGALRLWCGAVGTPPPRVSWSRDGVKLSNRDALFVQPFTIRDEGIYSCSVNGIRRSWKVVALLPPHWEGAADSVNASEGGSARVTCGIPHGQPTPTVQWLLNAELMRNGKGVKTNDTDLYIEHVEKRHAGIVQCFACNSLGCAFDAAMLTVVPVQISDQDYSAEAPKIHIPSQPPKRHNKKNSRKHKAVMIPPSRPNVTRMSDESVMVSWSNAKEGLPIQFFKVQYKEVSNSSDSTNSTNGQWHTANYDIPSYIHAFEIDGLVPDRYYKFRIAAVYSNQDNKLGRSSPRFYLQRGGQSPNAPVLTKATATSPHSIHLEWTWSSSGGVEAEGFYVYYRAVSSAGAYEKVSTGGDARALALDHLAPDTAYELKVQAYNAQAPSDFSAILDAKTHKSTTAVGSTTEAAHSGAPEKHAPAALVTAGGALGVAAILLILVVTLLLCRRAKRPNKKASVPETGSGNGYMPAKVPITITANPMHAEGGEAGVEMSFLHNNNTGSSEETLPHSRKNGPARQYV
ncbi:interference hedgehog isoform X2 [Battus philenor]|uniref:interference hedgehog isoform X2 n=1 Tax=Battus philenor TaxID=42288 RepID=UPI0035D0C6F0